MLSKIGANHILIETDSPYLPPEEERGEQNTPLNIRYTIRKIAEELDIEEDEVIELTTKNAQGLFKI